MTNAAEAQQLVVNYDIYPPHMVMPNRREVNNNDEDNDGDWENCSNNEVGKDGNSTTPTNPNSSNDNGL